jgi:hypothetical protein
MRAWTAAVRQDAVAKLIQKRLGVHTKKSQAAIVIAHFRGKRQFHRDGMTGLVKGLRQMRAPPNGHAEMPLKSEDKGGAPQNVQQVIRGAKVDREEVVQTGGTPRRDTAPA